MVSIIPQIDQGTLPALQQREPQIVLFNNSMTVFELVPGADFVITEMNGGLIVIPSSVFGNAWMSPAATSAPLWKMSKNLNYHA